MSEEYETWKAYAENLQAQRENDSATIEELQEALARVEAERDAALAHGNHQLAGRTWAMQERDTAQAQLEEALTLIGQHLNDLGDACGSFESQHDVDVVTQFLDVLMAFFARHAQAGKDGSHE